MKRSCPVYEIERECSFCHERRHIKMDCEALLNKIKRDKLRQERLLPFGTFIEKSIEETRVVSNLQNSNEKKIEELQEKLGMMLQFKKELTTLTERNRSM